MKKITLSLCIIILNVMVFAQTSEKKWAIGLGPGINHNLETGNNHFLGDIYLSRYLSPSFDLMLDNRAAFYKDGIDLVNPLLNLRYKLSNGYIFKENSAIQPFLVGGVGYLWDNEADGVTFDGGAGFKVPVSPGTSLFVAATYVKGIESQVGNSAVTEDHLQVTSILEFALGKNDSDGDGVKDKKDECPDTPAGVAVDEKGCPLDGDGDGVPDYKDECPDEAGEQRFNGCPDKDGDGIPDKEDDCPDVAGLAKFNGCPDSDEDGVQDPKDKCPNTPKGCPVDANGCPLDSDGDGVIDCEDKCPTEAGSKENDGCRVEEPVDFDPIYFDLEKDELKPESIKLLDEIVDALQAKSDYEVVIEGHACDLGTEIYNQTLSEKRAQAVVKYLLKKGINSAYVGSDAYGESQPALPNTSEENRQKNRRAEFKIKIK